MSLPFVRYLRLATFVCACCLISLGCADDKKQPTTRPMTVKERQDAMLRDPMGYKPDSGSQNISGGKINEFDKDAFKKDVDSVFNP